MPSTFGNGNGNGAKPKVLSPSTLAHVGVRTTNLKAMVSWYQEFLGANIAYADENIAFLSYDEEHHRIAILKFPDTTDRVDSAAGYQHIAFSFNTLDDLACAYQQRKAIGILPSMTYNHGPTTSIYYKDPDGNNIETQVDNFDTVDATNEFMRGPLFQENPVGTQFDPEDLVRQLQDGVDHAIIKKRVEIGPRSLADV